MQGGPLRRFVIALFAGLALAGSAAELAQAQSCYALEAELSFLQRRASGSGGDRTRYERAFREQLRVLQRSEARAQNSGCFGGGFFLFRDEPDPICRTLVPKLRQMQINLDRLDQLRRRAGNGNERRIRQIERAMEARSCPPPGTTDWTIPATQERETFEELPREAVPGGTYRTLCVRTCDGYYFPISFSTTPEHFGDDAAACSRMCGGTETKLFFHPNPGGGPESMTSLEGETYSSLPTAFQYRTNLAPACTCQAAAGTISAGAQPSLDTKAEPLPALLPRPRPEPGEDPETLADRAGGFVPGAAARAPAAAPGPMVTGPDGKPVRVVGPAYLDAPEQAGVVLTPVPN
jgi:hypothetical protein